MSYPNLEHISLISRHLQAAPLQFDYPPTPSSSAAAAAAPPTFATDATTLCRCLDSPSLRCGGASPLQACGVEVPRLSKLRHFLHSTDLLHRRRFTNLRHRRCYPSPLPRASSSLWHRGIVLPFDGATLHRRRYPPSLHQAPLAPTPPLYRRSSMGWNWWPVYLGM